LAGDPIDTQLCVCVCVCVNHQTLSLGTA